MCNGSTADWRKPEVKLAELLSKELGVTINSAALRLLLQHQWTRVTVLAHAIHDERRNG